MTREESNSIIDGIEWADKTLITKACKYLKMLVYQDYPGAPLERFFDDEIIKDFRKAMEE